MPAVTHRLTHINLEEMAWFVYVCLGCICVHINLYSLHCNTGAEYASDCDICCCSSTGISLVSAAFFVRYFSYKFVTMWEKVYHAFVLSLRDGHKPGKSGILMDFLCATWGKTDFALWVQPVSSNPYASKCIWCTKTVDLSSTERQAVVSHMSSSWCGMTLDIWRSLLRIRFFCDNL